MRNVTFLSAATSVDFSVSFGVGRLCGNWAEARGVATATRAARATATPNRVLDAELMGETSRVAEVGRVTARTRDDRLRPGLSEQQRREVGQVSAPDHPGVGPGGLLRGEFHSLLLQ